VLNNGGNQTCGLPLQGEWQGMGRYTQGVLRSAKKQAALVMSACLVHFAARRVRYTCQNVWVVAPEMSGRGRPGESIYST